MTVTKDYKLAHFYYDIDEWELYDRKSDPSDLHNVYDDPSYEKVKADLRNRLTEIRRYYGDSPDLDRKFIEFYRKEGLIE